MTTTPVRPRARPRRSPALIVATLSLCGVVVSLQQTLMLPLLPDLPRLLDTTVDNASWLITATLLTGAVATPTMSRLADMYGKRLMMMVALVFTIVGSAIGALSEALPLMVTARALQGVGVALIPIGIAIMRDELPREKLPLGVALMSATLAIGAGVGLPLSGLIAEHLDWHAIFWVSGAVGTVLLVVAMRILPESPVRTRGAFDYRGAVLLTVSLTALLLALSKGGQWGWTSGLTLGLAVAGFLVLAVWVPLELRTGSPLVDLRVAARPAVALVNLASLLTGFAMFANMLVTIQLLQQPTSTGYGLGMDVLHAGLWMVPNAVAFAVLAPISARMVRTLGPQMTLLVGTLVMAVSYVARIFLSDNLGQVVTGSVLVGVGTAMAYAAIPTLVMRAVPVTETASANGLNVLLRSLGTSTSSAVMAAVATMGAITVAGTQYPSLGALTSVFWLASAASLVAAMVTVPMLRMREYAEDAEDVPERERLERVVHGMVVAGSGKPVRNAVVTVLTPAGDHVDWSQVDSAGAYAVAIPRGGEYLVVTAAEGWTPTSRLMRLDEHQDAEPVELVERLRLSGTVREGAAPVPGATVVLTRQAGETVRSARTGPDGRYEVPLPPNGRYVVTVVTAAGITGSRAVTVWGATRTADLDLAGVAP